MKLSIKKIFFNLKMSLLILGVGTTLMAIQLINISQYSDRLSALKNQHVLIKKITATNLKDLDMATISINSDLAELDLFLKLSNKDALLEYFIASTTEHESLTRSLISTSKNFQEAALFWSESMINSRDGMYERMISARNLYLIDIDVMIDYQIQLINQAISMANTTALVLFLFALITYFIYQWRLNQIYRDLNKACSIDTDGNQTDMSTIEVDFIFRRLSRKMPQINTNLSLLHPQSGINNEKGLLAMFSTKRNEKIKGTLFVALYEIDKHMELDSTLSRDEMNAIYKKIGDIFSMYEQANDITGQLDNNNFAIIMTRASKENALADAEKIIASIHDSIFQTSKGSIKLTMSGGLLLKIPTKSLEETLTDAAKVVIKAKEAGGNRVAQLRDGADKYR